MYRHLAKHPDAKIALTGWNAYSRIDAVTGHADELARLYIDSDAWTGMHRWDGKVESIRSLSTWYPRAAVRVHAAGEDARHRPGRRVRRAGGARLRQPERDRRRDEPADAALRPPLRGARPATSTTARGSRRSCPKGRNYLSRTDRAFDVIFLGLRGLVGGGRLGRPLAVRELPLHDRGIPRLLRPPDAPTARSRSCAGRRTCRGWCRTRSRCSAPRRRASACWWSWRSRRTATTRRR